MEACLSNPRPSGSRTASPSEQHLRIACGARGITIFVNARARAAGLPHIELRMRSSGLDLGLREFSNYKAALQWLAGSAP
ncbi:hypothetical protein HHL11_07140 [Ramlibacter sp. G-1-2-2]|uniref:Uncharacterized protein n=1 Tax=Ramlibacter agri TaxID=2728837 RepID=A0A848GZC6_9BURK|nr:hypothetical protein [Ramlibacter agri]NML43517.1 hypothetical protein [Ramlibacter agri]